MYKIYVSHPHRRKLPMLCKPARRPLASNPPISSLFIFSAALRGQWIFFIPHHYEHQCYTNIYVFINCGAPIIRSPSYRWIIDRGWRLHCHDNTRIDLLVYHSHSAPIGPKPLMHIHCGDMQDKIIKIPRSILECRTWCHVSVLSPTHSPFRWDECRVKG